MAFIKTTTNKEGRTHVYLVEGYRKDGKVKQRILKKYGLLDELPNFKLKLATHKKFTRRLVVQAFFRVIINPIFD
ncbi:hypothetical protein HO995_06555, partial [Streptococcus suis]|nr:hypothetical protein [Streptococcus suis]